MSYHDDIVVNRDQLEENRQNIEKLQEIRAQIQNLGERWRKATEERNDAIYLLWDVLGGTVGAKEMDAKTWTHRCLELFRDSGKRIERFDVVRGLIATFYQFEGVPPLVKDACDPKVYEQAYESILEEQAGALEETEEAKP